MISKSRVVFHMLIIISTICVISVNSAKPTDAKKVYKIGDIGPAGGFIFYDKGKKTDGWRYLEAAKEDVNDGGIPWKLFLLSIKNKAFTSDKIGSGKSNTEKIIKALDIEWGNKEDRAAVFLCKNYSKNKFHDWFLPSKGELNLMYKNLHKKGIGNFTNELYWSSTESIDKSFQLEPGEDENVRHGAWCQKFKTGAQYHSSNFKMGLSYGMRVRPVRAF